MSENTQEPEGVEESRPVGREEWEAAAAANGAESEPEGETPDEAPVVAPTGDDDDEAAPEVGDDPAEPVGGENDATEG